MSKAFGFLARRAWLIAVITVFAIGTIGFLQQHPRMPYPEAFYRALQLFFADLNTFPWPVAPGETPVFTMNPWIAAARFLAPFLLVAFVVEAFSNLFTLKLRKFWQLRRWRQRVVMLGFGAVGQALTRHLIAAGQPVTAIAQTFNEADRDFADANGVLLIEGNLSDRRILVEADLARSSDVFVAGGSDDVNIEVGALAAGILRTEWAALHGPGSIARQEQPPVLHVHLSSTRLAADLGDARDLGFSRGQDFLPFSLKTWTATDLLVQARLTDRAQMLRQRRVHVVLFGFGDYGEALVEEILLTSVSAGLDAPKITILDSNRDLAESRFAALYPHFRDETLIAECRPAIAFDARDLRSLDVENDRLLADLDASEDPPTAYILACGDDLENLRAGLRLEMAMQRLRRRAVPVYARLWDTVLGPEEIPTENPFSMLRTFGNARETAARFLKDATRIEDLAQRLHAEYLTPPRNGSRFSEARSRMRLDWERLPAHIKRSNLRGARHGASKLISLGLQWRGMHQGTLPRFSSQMGQDLRDALDSVNWAQDSGFNGRLIEIAETEHRRWMIDRAIEGFKPAPGDPDNPNAPLQRDNTRRLHPMMRPFADLAPNEKGNDLKMIRALVGRPPDTCDPLAFWRKAAILEIGDSAQWDLNEMLTCTELDIRLAAHRKPLAHDALDPLLAIIRDWSRQASACVLRLHLFEPVREIHVANEEASVTALRSLMHALEPLENTNIFIQVAYHTAEPDPEGAN